jgi:hypothetical protein
VPEKNKRMGGGKMVVTGQCPFKRHNEVGDGRPRAPRGGKEWGRGVGGGGSAGWSAPAWSRRARLAAPRCKIEAAGWLSSGARPQ